MEHPIAVDSRVHSVGNGQQMNSTYWWESHPSHLENQMTGVYGRIECGAVVVREMAT